MIATRLMTAADLDLMGPDGDDYELIDGVPYKEEGVSEPHGRIAFDVGALIAPRVSAHRLGFLYSSDTQFVLSPDGAKVVRPDVAFVRRERRPREVAHGGRMPFAPDLAIEVVSPGDTGPEIGAKTQLYLDAGTTLVWVIWEALRQVSVFRRGRAELVLVQDDSLDGEDVLPGFRLPVRAILASSDEEWF